MEITPYEVQYGEYTISTDPSRLDIDIIHDYLSNRSYWAQGREKATTQRVIETCLCFGVYKGDEQVGFARVLTDYGILNYIADVFVLESHRGRGLGKALIRAILDHPDLRDMPQWLLATRDAHGLYSRFGFRPLDAPERAMSIGFLSRRRGEEE